MFLEYLLITLMMEAARTSETLVNFYQITQRYNPEESNMFLNSLPVFLNQPMTFIVRFIALDKAYKIIMKLHQSV
jgi:hypothetical protein